MHPLFAGLARPASPRTPHPTSGQCRLLPLAEELALYLRNNAQYPISFVSQHDLYSNAPRIGNLAAISAFTESLREEKATVAAMQMAEKKVWAHRS